MESHVLLCTRDPVVVEAVEVSAAALDVPVRVVDDALGLREGWTAASVRLLGVDAASRWGLAGPGAAFVVGTSGDDLARCSSQLSVPVVPLPQGAQRLSAVLSDALLRRPNRGTMVALVGASGGLGTSTITAAFAALAARAGESVALVDLAPGSGGIDLLLGGEAAEGIRWPDLSRARGELGDIVSLLPKVGGVSVLSQGRAQAGPPPREAVEVVLGALSRTAGFTFIDAGRGTVPAGADMVVLVVGADVSSVAAAQALDATVGRAGLIVRRGPGRSIPPDVVGRTLGLACLGTVGEHRGLPRLAERGLPPVPGPVRRFVREIGSLWERVRDA